jgi:hypothetical protein
MNKPIEISLPEWEEIIALQVVRESWGLDDETTAEDFASWVYGVKFDFMSGSPGYVGPLYIVQGDILTGDAPFIFGRYDGKLQMVYGD